MWSKFVRGLETLVYTTDFVSIDFSHREPYITSSLNIPEMVYIYLTHWRSTDSKSGAAKNM